MTITINLDFTDDELAYLDAVLAAVNANGQADVDARNAALPPDGTPEVFTPETRDDFLSRLAQKAAASQIDLLRADLDARNLAIVLSRYNDPATTQMQRSATIDPLGLTFDGLRVVPKP